MRSSLITTLRGAAADSNTLAIFRHDGTLNAQNILYMQAEINELEKELQEISKGDRYSGNEEKQRSSLSHPQLDSSHFLSIVVESFWIPGTGLRRVSTHSYLYISASLLLGHNTQ